MKRLLLTAAIILTLRTAAQACPVQIDGNATTTARDTHTRGNVTTGITLIMVPPQAAIPKRDVQASSSASMTVRWNSAPAKPLMAKTARVRVTPALPPLAITL